LEASELKTLMAILFLSVGVAVAYNTFFRDHKNILNNNSSNPVETNQFYETLIELIKICMNYKLLNEKTNNFLR